MELLDSSMDKISEKLYSQNKSIPENILGKMTVCVSRQLYFCCCSCLFAVMLSLICCPGSC